MQPSNSRARRTTYLVPEPELFLPQLHTSPQALSHTEPLLVHLARELKTDASEPRVVGGVDAEAGCEFGYYGGKVACFEAGGGGVSAVLVV